MREREMAAEQRRERGLLILFEGIDRSGKTTQCRMLFEKLRSEGIEVRQQRFPDRSTALGKMIDGYLQKKTPMSPQMSHLLFSANRWEAKDKIEALLNRGVHVILDRYAHSGVAYSIAQMEDCGSCEQVLNWCIGADEGLTKPDVQIFLDLGALDARKRRSYGEELHETVEMQSRVVKAYRDILFGENEWLVLDAMQSKESVHSRIWKHVSEKLRDQNLRTSKLNKLWR